MQMGFCAFRFLVSTEAAELPATVVLNKADLVPAEECSRALAEVCALAPSHTSSQPHHSLPPNLQMYVLPQYTIFPGSLQALCPDVAACTVHALRQP